MAEEVKTLSVPEPLFHQMLACMDELEAWVDGAITVAGQHANPPLNALQMLDDIRAQVHPVLCPSCAADSKAKSQRSNVTIINGGKPPEDKDIH